MKKIICIALLAMTSSWACAAGLTDAVSATKAVADTTKAVVTAVEATGKTATDAKAPATEEKAAAPATEEKAATPATEEKAAAPVTEEKAAEAPAKK